MRLLQFAFLLALASGFAAILIYITGVSNLCKLEFFEFCISLSLSVCKQLHVIVICIIIIFLIWFAFVDYNRISDEDYEALESLQNDFRKCVVSGVLFLFLFFPMLLSFDL